MAQESNRAFSRLPSIGRIEALASILSTTPSELGELSENVECLWKPGKILIKENGDLRRTSDARKPLKAIHERIKNRILKQVDYPAYLLGGIADKLSPRDYKKHATIHANKKILISEDVQDFFPSTSEDVVRNIWQRFFNFHPDVANLLTVLTTYKNSLPQGWKPSGYLANLALWDIEPDLVALLRRQGFSYSRFMDDITVSAPFRMSKDQQRQVITGIFAALKSHGYSPKRAKHQIFTGSQRMVVTGLNVNAGRPTLPKKKRNNTRAQVHHCELHFTTDHTSLEYRKLWTKASGKVAELSRFHSQEAATLRRRLRAIKPHDSVSKLTN